MYEWKADLSQDAGAHAPAACLDVSRPLVADCSISPAQLYTGVKINAYEQPPTHIASGAGGRAWCYRLYGRFAPTNGMRSWPHSSAGLRPNSSSRGEGLGTCPSHTRQGRRLCEERGVSSPVGFATSPRMQSRRTHRKERGDSQVTKRYMTASPSRRGTTARLLPCRSGCPDQRH